jgi:hypothetical protein
MVGQSTGAAGRTTEVAEAIDLAARASRVLVARLVRQGLGRRVGMGSQDPKRRYVC